VGAIVGNTARDHPVATARGTVPIGQTEVVRAPGYSTASGSDRVIPAWETN